MRPHRRGGGRKLGIPAGLLTIQQKCAKPAGHGTVGKGQDHPCAELKASWKLLQSLPKMKYKKNKTNKNNNNNKDFVEEYQPSAEQPLLYNVAGDEAARHVTAPGGGSFFCTACSTPQNQGSAFATSADTNTEEPRSISSFQMCVRVMCLGAAVDQQFC
eukprot:m.348292 g.348292  ORF g.348292 m.348292 type:complete len:159 (+) comp19876_c3_seq4:197-673(+)